MARLFAIILIFVGIAGCNHDDDTNSSCSNPVEVTGTPSIGYIIVVKESNDPSLVATEYIETYGDKINVYTTGTTFFAAEMSGDVLSVIQCDSRIESIEYDGVVGINY